jgi:hypothetical protein
VKRDLLETWVNQNEQMAQVSYDAFCDKIDDHLDLLDTEQKRRKKRFWYMYISIRVWIWYMILSLPFVSTVNVLYWPISLMACALQIFSVWLLTMRPKGTKSDKGLLRLIRSECDTMTRTTPFVSFHLVVIPTLVASRVCAYVHMDTVDHIEVSISMSASASGVATTESAQLADTSESKALTSNGDDEHPVVYAHAILSPPVRGEYQQVQADAEIV